MIIDPTILESYRDFMEEEADEFIAEILNDFYENSMTLLNTLDEALKQGLHEEFTRAAHTLKSTSATVGATRLSGLAANLEQRGKDGQLTDLAPLLVPLQEAFDEAKAKLEELYKQA